MKRSTLFLLMGLISLAAVAQNFKITTKDNQDITNSTHTIMGTSVPMEEGFHFENLNVDSTDVMLKRYETNVIANTKNYFCWGDCFGSDTAGKHPVWYAFGPIRLGKNQVEPSTHVYYEHLDKPGKSTFLYVYYDVSDTTDSAWVEVIFDVPDYVGVNELTAADVKLNASPNPASGLIRINYDISNYAGNNATIVLVDLLGKRHGEYRIRNKQGKLEIDAGQYVPGIYFYSLQVDGRLITTKKIIVN